MRFPEQGDYDVLKLYVLEHTISSICVNCARTMAINLEPFNDYDPQKLWSTSREFEVLKPGMVVQVFCCQEKGFWAAWHRRWHNRVRNQKRRLRQKPCKRKRKLNALKVVLNTCVLGDYT